MKIGEKIYTFRKTKGLSQEELAELLDVSRQSVSKWETDAAVPELDKLVGMCEIFGITLDQLTGREICSPTPSTDIPPKTAPVSLTPVKVLGIVLIGIALLGRIFTPLLLVMYPKDAYLLLPLLLATLVCGFICLCLKKHIGYWCTWTALVPLCFLIPRMVGLPILSGIGGMQLLCFVAVVIWTATRFPPLSVPVSGKRVALLIALCLLCLSAHVAALFLFPHFFLLYLANCISYAAMVVLLTYTTRCIKTRKTNAQGHP